MQVHLVILLRPKLSLNKEEINTNMITNPSIQTTKVLDGEHYLHLDQLDEIVRISKEFIKSNLQ